MNISRLLVAAGAAAVVVAGLSASPALADGTDTTFEVLSGTLDITVPASANMGTGAPGSAVAGSLGTVTVIDDRASADGSWEATVTSTTFTTGTGTASETVLASEIEYWSGPATATTGSGTFTPGQTQEADAAALDTTTPLTAFTHVGGTGNNTASWAPGITVNLPLDDEAGIYAGTVTHSVA